MEDSSISVEELSICFGDNKVVRDEKDFVKDEDEDDIRCERIRKRKNFPADKLKGRQERNKAKSPIPTKANGQQIRSKPSTLPSLGQAKDSRLAENFERSRAQQDAVWTLCTALNVPSKEQSLPSSSISSSDPQLHLCDKSSECKPGRTILAPLQDGRKQHFHSKHSGNKSLVLKPQSPPKGKHDKESDHEAHFTPISKSPRFGQEEDSLGEKRDEEMVKPKAKFLSPTQGLNEDLAGADFHQNRRFSMPISPRLLRRFNKDKLYTSKKDGLEREDKHNFPERSSIFSPPSQEFDSIQDENDDDKFSTISNDIIPLKLNRENRRSLDLNLGTNSLRFLSEIKLSLGKEPSSEPVFPKVRTKSEQRKNSYGLSASSEALFKDSLPEVVVPSTTLPHVHPEGRNRASTFTSLEAVVPFESKMLGKTTLEAPLLDVGTRRLSHLSLSPRLPRKR